MAAMRTGSKPAAWILGFLLAGGACGVQGDLPTTPDPPSPPVPPSEAVVALSLSPSPVDALIDVDDSELLSAEWTVTVQETAGIGGDIDLVRATLADSAGASIAETELDAEQVSEQLGGSNHLGGGSTQELLMSLSFDFPSDVLLGDLNVSLELTDDNGNTISATADDVIQRCIPALLAPDEGAMLDNGCEDRDNGILWEFEWSACENADFYNIFIQLRTEDEPRADESELTSTTFTVLEDRVVPEEARFDWFWKVRANVNGTWGEWSPERAFDVEPVNSDCVTP